MQKWYDTAVFYHIYPLGFCGAPAVNEERRSGSITHRMRMLLPCLEHIKQLGCTAVYIGPLFESSAHGYDTIDYKKVDSRLGDDEDFRDFVRKAHHLGIRVVVDGVFNHTGREFFAFEDIKARREQSPYQWWYKGINFGWNSAYNDGFSYESWRNCGDLVNLNLQNREVKDYLFDVIRYWIHEFDIDGIRLDCADVLDFDFMKEMRWMTGNEKQDFYLLGEVIHGDYARWVNDEMLHAVTNYELHKGLYSGHNDHNYFEIAHTIRRQFDENGGIYRGRVLYNFVDNHDVSRLVSKCNDPGHVRLVYALCYTLPGIPSIYYGSEFGLAGRKEEGDGALRPAIDLDGLKRNPPMPGLCEFIAWLGKIRAEHPALWYGRYRELSLTTTHYAYARICEEETIVVAANNADDHAEFWLHLPLQGKQIMDLATGEVLPAEYEQLHSFVGPDEVRIFCIR